MANNRLFFLVVLLGCLPQFASDLYAPAIPAIASQMHVSLSHVQFSLAIYMFGMVLSLIFFGLASEAIGRKKPLLLGLTIMLLGNVTCVFANDVHWLIVGRFIQGIGVGACAGIWRAVFRDGFSGEALAKYGSYLSLIVMFILPVAPIIGGYLYHFLGWRAIFWVISIYTLLLGVVVFLYKESNQYHHRDNVRWQAMRRAYGTLFSNRAFVTASLGSFITYGGFFSWITVSSVLLIHDVKITPVTYGWLLCLSSGVAFAISGLVNARLVVRFGMRHMMYVGWSVALMGGLMMLIGYLLFGISLWAILVPATLFLIGATIIWPNAFAMAMTPFDKIAGYAGSMYSFLQLLGGAIMGIFAAYLPHTSQLPLAIVLTCAPIVAMLFFEMADRNALLAVKL